MTVSSTTNKASYSGNGTTTVFTVPFYFLAAADLQVILRSSAGVETVQALTTQYTVTGAGVPSGGTVTMLTAPASGTTLTILRNAAATQETDLLPNDRLPAESLETALDKLTMLVQQLDEETGRSLKFPASDVAASAQIPASSVRAGKYLAFDASGLPTVSSSSPTPYLASDVSFIASGTGASPRSVSAKLRDMVSVKDFGAIGDGAADDTVAFANAATAAATTGAAVYVPATSSHYKLTDEVTLAAEVAFVGDGWGSRIRQYTRNKNIFVAHNNTRFSRLHLQGDNVTTASAVDKNTGIYASARARVVIEGCYATRFQNGLCQLRDCTDYRVVDNVCYDNPYSIASGAVNADINIYSGSNGLRGIIARNHCLSNNDFGIYHDANGFDLDAIIIENVVVTLSSGSEAASGGNRRHAIIAAYGGSVGGRTIIANNICRNTRLTGIYRAAASSPTGTHLIIGNHCSANGYDASNSLAGGIFLNVASPATKIIGNFVEDFRGTSNLGNGAIVVNNSPSPVEIRANTVTGSQGHGILIKGTTQEATISDNLLRGNATADIAIQHSGNGSDGGGHEVFGNRIYKGVNTKPAIRVVSDASTRTIRIVGNRGYGTDKTTASAGENAFLNVEGTTTTPLTVANNEVERFYYGLYYFANIQSGRGGFHHVIDGNQFRDLNTAILVIRASSNDCLPVCGNTFTTVSTAVTGGAYLAERKGLKIALTGLASAAPSDGTWEAGDISWRTAPVAGGAPGDVCTTGGAPGTWKAMANVAP